MHNPNTVTIKPAIPHTNGVSWNPDAIDVTVNPNKGRKGLKTIHNTALLAFRNNYFYKK